MCCQTRSALQQGPRQAYAGVVLAMHTYQHSTTLLCARSALSPVYNKAVWAVVWVPSRGSTHRQQTNNAQARVHATTLIRPQTYTRHLQCRQNARQNIKPALYKRLSGTTAIETNTLRSDKCQVVPGQGLQLARLHMCVLYQSTKQGPKHPLKFQPSCKAVLLHCGLLLLLRRCRHAHAMLPAALLMLSTSQHPLELIWCC